MQSWSRAITDTRGSTGTQKWAKNVAAEFVSFKVALLRKFASLLLATVISKRSYLKPKIHSWRFFLDSGSAEATFRTQLLIAADVPSH